MSGKEYISQRGKTIPEKMVKSVDCKCKYKCKEKITENQRKKYLNYFGRSTHMTEKKRFYNFENKSEKDAKIHQSEQ